MFNLTFSRCTKPIIYEIYHCKSMSSRARISISVIIHYSEWNRRSKCHETVLRSLHSFFIKTFNVHDFSLAFLRLSFCLCIANCFVTIFNRNETFIQSIFQSLSDDDSRNIYSTFNLDFCLFVLSQLKNYENMQITRRVDFAFFLLLRFYSSMEKK